MCDDIKMSTLNALADEVARLFDELRNEQAAHVQTRQWLDALVTQLAEREAQIAGIKQALGKDASWLYTETLTDEQQEAALNRAQANLARAIGEDK